MTTDHHLEPGTEIKGQESGAAGHTDPDGAARRSVLRGALALGAVGLGGALAGCGSSNSASHDTVSTGTGSAGTGGDTGATTPSAAPSAAATSAAPAPAGGGQVLGPAAALVVGGGVVYDAAKVVVTQPTAGAYKAFTAVCTHQQCIVDNVEKGTINCACHGSKYSITDGSVVHGPATSPLAAKTVSVADGNVTLTA
jgi:Rieske Fe-S protein